MANLIECDVDGCHSYETVRPYHGYGPGSGLPDGWRTVTYSVKYEPPPDIAESVTEHPQLGQFRSMVRGLPHAVQSRQVTAHVCPVHVLPTFKPATSDGAYVVPMLSGVSVVGG